MEFTTRSIRDLKLERGAKEAIFFDDDVPGFGIRMREGGSKTWIFQYRLGGKQRRMSLGSADAISLTKARDGERDKHGKVIHRGAKDLHATVRLGGDPAGETKQAKRAAGQTFKALAEDFLKDKEASLKPTSYADVKRHMTKCATSLEQLQVGKISRSDVKDCLRVVAKNRGEVTSNRVQTTLSTFFAWCIEHEHGDINPVIGITRHDEESRDRVLFPAELRAIWKALPNDHYGSVVKLLALTGQRAAEMGGLRWSELNEEGDTIDLPPERTKNGRRHFVPLSAPARAVIEARPHRADNGNPRDLIFGLGKGPFSGWSNCKEALDAKLEKALGKRLPHFTLHDLRRSMSTYLGGGLGDDEIRNLPPEDRKLADGLQIEPHVIEAVLNHVSGFKAGVAGIYNRSPYAREKRQALELWADRLMAIVEERTSNVASLAAHREAAT
jgi:integrase